MDKILVDERAVIKYMHEKGLIPKDIHNDMPDHMLKLWLREVLKTVHNYEPGMVALHCQEVGGKNYEASMQHVNQFVKAMLGCEELQKYDRARVFLDEDYTAADKFTALGNLYFIHECLEDVAIWDFMECRFVPVEGREVLSGNIENVQIKEKAKFPQDFFPDFKWSRKGFIRTRWSIRNVQFDLINIHLFHDASNIIAMQDSPSVYSGNRKAAFLHTLKRFEQDQFDKVPMFIFGDFNFRLDSKRLVQTLTSKTKSIQTKGKKDQVSKIVYTDENNGKTVLTIESKGFDHHDKHTELFFKRAKTLHKYDNEIHSYKDKVAEFDITFPPSYPFSEDVNDGMCYMKTRCPSWCDRILLSHSAKNIIFTDEKHKPRYDLIGKDICMGDHKPVYLFLHLKRSQGNSSVPSSPVDPSKSPLRNSLSINGEVMDSSNIDSINIHDFAVFEEETALLPEFKNSVRLKQRPSNTQQNLHVNTKPTVERKASFQEIASKVLSMEKVLMRWPKSKLRPRDRHHSSSSEDDLHTDTDSKESMSNIDGKLDNASTHTSQSEISLTDPSGEGGSPERVVMHDDVVLSVLSNKHEHDMGKGDVAPANQNSPKSTSLLVNIISLFPAPTVSAPELLQLPTATEVIVPSTQVKISHVDTTKYIHIRQQNGSSTRVFRETSV
ncbi:hypothetical protein FSP39_006936 [Pinctada imbricata]|uniref:inositol-polyphosphate 5-phosphatase n=1 Tax=Pinctada imbricata TaxID=66713 RepID=A0AA88Y2Q4_PINIB|nr:hypothetical protein FSP39_006936 [Pinctada imbricata]